MIDKVLIAEDHESSNISVQKSLEELNISGIDHVYYCDDAILKLRQSLHKNQPYDLLITDLHFESDDRLQDISSGWELIREARNIQPGLKILVFSLESRPATIEMLYSKYDIDGYVRKARNDFKELKTAISTLSTSTRYYPRTLDQMIKQKNLHDFSDFDITIISLLAQGVQQKNIPAYLKQNNFRASGLSSIEKRLNTIRDIFGFTKNEQLVAYCKDMGII